MKEYPVKVGSMLFTMVDPHEGHEVDFNRWYERDHYYGGCLQGPWLLAGSRWVSTRALKDLRFPEQSTLAKPAVGAGSFLAMYWVTEDKLQDWNEWANKQVFWLYKNDRGFDHRTHVHTLLYDLDWTHYRDEDPVPVELALDHRYAGLVTLAVERHPGVEQAQLDAWMKDYLPGFLEGSPVAQCSVWSPIPQGDAPMSIPKVERTEALDMQIFFIDAPAADAWSRFRLYADALEATGLAKVVFASPWLPTVPGTDTYTDQLW
jgi:hypothetical protein